jgi:hypothetical protein
MEVLSAQDLASIILTSHDDGHDFFDKFLIKQEEECSRDVIEDMVSTKLESVLSEVVQSADMGETCQFDIIEGDNVEYWIQVINQFNCPKGDDQMKWKDDLVEIVFEDYLSEREKYMQECAAEEEEVE